MKHPLRERRERRERLAALAAGEAVALPARVRSTTTRGWGPWTEAEVLLDAEGTGRASWRTQDPRVTTGVASHGRAARPFVDLRAVELRRVRFAEEAFHGRDAEIVVVDAIRGTTEIAVPADECEHLYRRLDGLLG